MVERPLPDDVDLIPQGISDGEPVMPTDAADDLEYVELHADSQYVVEDRLGSLAEEMGDQEAEAYLDRHAPARTMTRVRVARRVGRSALRGRR